jgi:hypothetical protein
MEPCRNRGVMQPPNASVRGGRPSWRLAGSFSWRGRPKRRASTQLLRLLLTFAHTPLDVYRDYDHAVSEGYTLSTSITSSPRMHSSDPPNLNSIFYLTDSGNACGSG